jgi:ABC-2 type transport system permease protein
MNSLVGTRALVRLALRRDRVMLPVWIVVLVGTAASSASATVGLYPTVASRVQAAASVNDSASLVALYGRIYDPTSLGALAMFKTTGIGAILVAILTMVTVVRHTRAEEEAGRLELVGATVVGRQAPLAAALLVAVATNVVLGLLTVVALIGSGLPASGSVAFGLTWAGVGIAFGAVAALAAQLAESGRAANGMAVAALGAAYVLRAVGDATGDTEPAWISWISPIGWGQQIRPFAGDRWWLVLLPLAFAAVLGAGAYALSARRDLGAGLLPPRLGPATAGPRLRSPLALAWRLHRSSLLAWATGFALVGLLLGNIASNVGGFVNSPQAQDFFRRLGGAKALTDTFLATELGIAGVIASAYAIQAAMRLRSEETALRAEPVLATAVGRIRFAASHLVVAMLGGAALLLVAGLGAGIAYAASIHDGSQIGRVVAGALVQVPAVWVLTGIVVAAFGLAPRLVVAGWGALVVFLLLGEIGPLLKLDQRIMDVSPYAHVPRLPGSAFHPTPIVLLTLVAAALIAAGLAGFRRRDIG